MESNQHHGPHNHHYHHLLEQLRTFYRVAGRLLLSTILFALLAVVAVGIWLTIFTSIQLRTVKEVKDLKDTQKIILKRQNITEKKLSKESKDKE
jgi:hypothetical protein